MKGEGESEEGGTELRGRDGVKRVGRSEGGGRRERVKREGRSKEGGTE